MRTKIKSTSFKKNILLSIGVQIISIFVSFLLNLVVPKFISEIDYAHWQTYVLYAGYVGVLHFGLLDGIVLRYSQYDYEELDKPRIRSQLRILLILDILISVVIMCIIFCFVRGAMLYIFLYVALGIITKNIFTYTSYIFQITNQISCYATIVITQRLSYGIITILLLTFNVQDFNMYCIADLLGDLLGCLVGFWYCKDLFWGKVLSIKDSLKEYKMNVSSGVMLLIANWSATLLVGSAKMIIQWHWNELTFGKVSFSFSLSNLFLTFVTAISVVLFPSLKRMNTEQLPLFYKKIRSAISPLLFIALLFFFPGCLILRMWLPKYNESLIYLGILMPIIVYTSKVSLLTNNYLKAYREEKKMLIINVISIIIGVVLYVLCAYIFNNLTALLLVIVLMIMLRSMISEIVVMRIIKITMVKDFVIEVAMTVLFILCAKLLDFWIGFALYSVLLILYLFIYRDSIKPYLKRLRCFS